MDEPIRILRRQLSEFIVDHDTMIQFERLFELVEDLAKRVEALEAP
jgi:hypothetical protein